MQQPAPTLSYVRDYTRSDIAVLRDGPSVRVISPRPTVWRMILHWKAVGGLYLGTMSTVHIVGQLVAPGLGIRDLPTLLVGFFWLIGGLSLIAHHVYRSLQRRIIELSPTHLRVGTLRGSTPLWDDTWPRHLVAEIRPNRFTKALLIRITGIDMKDYAISPDPQAVEMAAAALNDALYPGHRPPTAS
jgi:hypothetical protein